MSNDRYQLIESLPYPRATDVGALADRAGLPLHGTYESKVPGGFRAVIVNNGRAIRRYDYPSSLAGGENIGPGSFANLVPTLYPWMVPEDSVRPVTDHPASEYPHADWRFLWDEPFVLDRVVTGRRPVGRLEGSLEDTAEWMRVAAVHGLHVSEVAARIDDLGRWHVVTQIARPGLLADDEDLRRLADAYAEQLRWYPLDSVLNKLRRLSAAKLCDMRMRSPQTPDELIVTGFCFGYPPATTAARIMGTHG